MLRLWLSILVLFIAIPVASAQLSPGDHKRSMSFKGQARSYIIHIPKKTNNKPWPVVINLHGGGGQAKGHQSYTGMDKTADKYGFVVVYPYGTGKFKKRLLSWNAGTCCSVAKKQNSDDVGFIRELINEVSKISRINQQRIYVTGLSNGAMMSYRLAAELPDKIAAIAPVAGAMVLESFKPKRPIPIMHIHSVDDPRALYNGGLGPPFPFTQVRAEHNAVETELAKWVKFNGCRNSPVKIDTRSFSTKSKQHTAEKWVYVKCKDKARVVLWKLTGSGHVWPGGKQDHMERLLGESTEVIDASEEMWKFFQQYKLAN